MRIYRHGAGRIFGAKQENTKMATAKEREEFIARFALEYPSRKDAVETARKLLRLAATHQRISEDQCNGPGDYVNRIPYPQAGKIYVDWEARCEKREAQTEKRIRELCAEFNLPVRFGGDPRGFTVKIKLPSGAYNSWGGSEEGYGVPS